MTGPGIFGAAVVLLGFGVAAVLLVPAATRRGLGILQPAVAWLALEGVFFGVGSLALALGEDQPGPAIYLGACVFATAVGVRLAHRFGPFAADAEPATGQPTTGWPTQRPSSIESETGLRRAIPAILAAAAIGLLVPTFLAHGLPLLSPDATAARAGLVGLPIQALRVAVPALTAVLMLEWLGGRPAFGRPAATWAIVAALIAFMLSLASRYLVIELLAGLAIAWLMTGRGVAIRTVAIAGLLGLVAFVAVGVLRAPEDFASGTGTVAAQRTISRIFLVQPRTLDALQATIPGEQPYFLGLTWFRRLGPLVGRDDIPNLGYWIYPKVVDAPQDVAGYAAPGLIGESWANFGPAGVGLFLLLGIGLEGLAAWVASHRSRVVDIAAGSLAILFVARTHALGLLGVAVLLALVVGWRIAAGAWVHRTVVPATPNA